MHIKLKHKYTWRNEPEKMKNRSGFKNTPQWGGGSSGGHGTSRTKKVDKGVGFSGRAIGRMLRQMPSSGATRKKK